MRRAPDAQVSEFAAFEKSQVPPPPQPPATRKAWDDRLESVRAGVKRSLGRMPAEDCSLDPEILGTLTRDGVTVERLTFQSRPGVRVTANLYRPENPSGMRGPAVLSVHGHWALARLAPQVRDRCVGLARLGYVALAVDALGSGERAVEVKAGTYHGGLIAASLFPSGLTLMGAQVLDNRRAVDYLISRPEVDASRIAITGASGGGNQSLYAGLTDPRLAAVIPVCGIGTLGSYIGPGCCLCEVLLGGLRYASTGDLLALIAPRPLLVINATKDVPQFSVGEALKSVDYARGRYQGLDAEARIQHLAVDSGHDYNQTMREALYGWLDRWFRDHGDGGPMPEPTLPTFEPAELRCYPEDTPRPATIGTIPELALREGRARLAALPPAADHPERFEADALLMRSVLRDDILGGFPSNSPPLDLEVAAKEVEGGGRSLTITSELEMRLKGRLLGPLRENPGRGTVVLLRPEGVAPPDDPLVAALRNGPAARAVLTVDLRDPLKQPDPDWLGPGGHHHPAQWGLWLGRPLLGQWAWDARRWLEALADIEEDQEAPPPVVVGVGPFALVALVAVGLGGVDARVGTLGGPVSFVGPGPWRGWDLGTIAPNILEVGDVGQLASLVAPNRLAVAGGTEPDGKPVSAERLRDAYDAARTVFRALNRPDRVTLAEGDDLAALLAAWED